MKSKAVLPDVRPGVLSLEGELCTATAASHRQALVAALAAPGFAGLDLAGVTRVDGAGLQLLLAAAREADARGVPLLATEPSRAVRAALSLAWLGEDLRALAPSPGRPTEGSRA